MAGYRMKRSVRDTWTRRLLISAINFFRKGKRSKFIIIGAAAAVIIAVVLVIVITSADAYTKTVSNTDPVPTDTGTPVSAATASPTATPTPIPTTTPPPDPTLQYGEENEQVQKLQQRLIDLGYLNLGFLDIDEPTQKFGPDTKAAVEWFQRQVGIDQTGIADGDTQERLYATDAPSYTLMNGFSGTDVTTLQQQLIDLGYLATGKKTGNYGELTTAAIKAFQQRNNLTVDGKTGQDTIALIYSPKAKVSASKAAEIRSKAKISKMIQAAKDKKGKPYVSGAEGPNSFDCSGLVYWCLKQAGSDRPRYTAQGYSEISDWTTVCSGKLDLNKLKAGDLLFFHVADRDRAIGHVAIYIGGGKVIDASSSNGKVVERPCTGPWFTSSFRLAKEPW